MSHLDLRPIHKVVNGEVKKVPILVDCSVKGGGSNPTRSPFSFGKG